MAFLRCSGNVQGETLRCREFSSGIEGGQGVVFGLLHPAGHSVLHVPECRAAFTVSGQIYAFTGVVDEIIQLVPTVRDKHVLPFSCSEVVTVPFPQVLLPANCVHSFRPSIQALDASLVRINRNR